MRIVRMGALLLALGVVMFAEVRPKGPTTPLEVDENGMPIVRVRLASKKADVPAREFRFIRGGAELSLMIPGAEVKGHLGFVDRINNKNRQ